MWVRHLLMLGICCGGLALVGSQTQKPDLELPDKIENELLVETDVVKQINTEFASHWYEQNLSPTTNADNLLIARRMSLALVGTVPSLEEIRAIESIEPDLQLGWWLEHLLTDRRSSDYIAERLARAYVGTEDGPFIVFRRRRFVSWLSDQLMKETPIRRNRAATD